MGSSRLVTVESHLMTIKIENPCGTGVPGWPRLLSIPCASAYLSRSTGFVEARLREGSIPYIVADSGERVIDRLELDSWIEKKPRQTGRLREPKAATAARVGVS